MTGQLDLFGGSSAQGDPVMIQRTGLKLRLWRSWLPEPELWHRCLRAEVPWKQQEITMYGRTYPIPRLTCWMGDPGCNYTYSGVANSIEAWTGSIEAIKSLVEKQVKCHFNSLLLNCYRDGRDKLDWHADDEPEIDSNAPIASLSLGASRTFRLRPKATSDEPIEIVSFELASGDLLVMDPPTQRFWRHQLPPRLRVKEERVNLTFRVIRKEAMAGV